MKTGDNRMRVKFSLPLWLFTLCVILFFFGTGLTVTLYARHESSKRAWKYKQMYNELRMESHHQSQNSEQYKEKLRLETMQFPDVLLKELKNENLGAKKIWTKQPYTVVVFFSDFDCSSCMKSELMIWNEFYKKFSDDVNVIGIAHVEDARVGAGILAIQVRGLVSFPTYVDSADPSIVSTLKINHTPSVFVVENRSRQIVKVHFGQDGAEHNSEVFRSSIESWLIESKQSTLKQPS